MTPDLTHCSAVAVAPVATTRQRRHRLALVLVAILLLSVRLAAAAGGGNLTATQRAWLDKASRHEKAGWVYLHIEGKPEERGFQHGYLLAPEIARGVEAVRANWEYQTAMAWEELLGKSAAMYAGKIDGENRAELYGIVEGLKAAGVASSRNEIVAYNAYIELIAYWWPQELERIKAGSTTPGRESCSAFIATGSRTADGGIVLGHNTMGGYQEMPMNVIIDIVPEKGQRILMQATPGWIHSGTDFFITAAGLVGAETTIGGFEGFDKSGIPEFCRMRRATQDARTIAEWCAIMKRGNNGGYANAWLLGDVNTGEIARLELGLRNVAFESTRDGYFTGSNVAEDLKILRHETGGGETDIRRSSIARRVRWKQLMAQYAGKIDVEAAKRFEADHFDVYLGVEHPGERSLCAHWELEHAPLNPWPTEPNSPGGTVDAKVVDTAMAKRMTFAARWGSGCGLAFDAGEFLARNPQYEWMRPVLTSRATQEWVTFTAGE